MAELTLDKAMLEDRAQKKVVKPIRRRPIGDVSGAELSGHAGTTELLPAGAALICEKRNSTPLD